MKSLIVLIFISLAVLGCSKEKDIDKIGDAQLCLDKLASSSTPAEVDECVAKVEGLESTGAYNIRCAGSFMKEGFLDPQKLVNAMEQLDSNSTTGFMGLITFTSAGNIATDTTNAYSAFDNCLKAEGKGSTLIASFGYVAMALYQYMDSNDSGNDCASTPTATGYPFETCATGWATEIGNAVSAAAIVNASTGTASAAAVQSSVGAMLISTYNLSCTGANANAELCGMIEQSITAAGGTSNPRAVAANFFTSSIF